MATGTWSIVLAVVHDPDPATLDRLAAQALERVQGRGGLPEAFVERRGKGAVIAYGHYATPDSTEAQEALARVREAQVDGRRPFADAFLSPPPGEAFRGSNPELDLRNARRFHGKRAMYTLQVGVYGRPDRKAPSAGELAEFRRAAEKASTDLRQDGELAFYYHGPNTSSVTVGVFTADDIDPKSPSGISQALRDARGRHPHNLLNGQGVRERAGMSADGQPAYRVQPSMVVAIPDR